MLMLADTEDGKKDTWSLLYFLLSFSVNLTLFYEFKYRIGIQYLECAIDLIYRARFFIF